MSYHIKIKGWTGRDQGEANARFAKVFCMQGATAAGIMRDVLRGDSWQFEHSVSQEQGEKARTYLQKLGYQVDLIPAVKARTLGEKVAFEPLMPPMEEAPPRKTFFDFLKREKPEPNRTKETPKQFERLSPDKADLPRHSFLDFLKKDKTALGKIDKADLPKHSFLDFLKKDKSALGKIEEEVPRPPKEPLLELRKKPASSKALQLILLLLLAASAALPYFFGMRTQAILNDLMPQLFQKDVIVQIKSYEMGWLLSTAEHVVKAKGIPPFTVTSAIIHGPISVEALLAGNLGGEYFQARIDSAIKLGAMTGEADPLENAVKKGYFVKKGQTYKMDLVIKDEGLLVNGILIPLPAR